MNLEIESLVRKYIGLEIQKRRVFKNISQEKLALASNIDRSYVSDIELGKKNISVLKLFEICETLDLKPSVLIKTIELSIEAQQTEKERLYESK